MKSPGVNAPLVFGVGPVSAVPIWCVQVAIALYCFLVI